MKVWKKLSAVALALVMVMALCVPAFAATLTAVDDGDMTGNDTEDGILGEFTNKGDVVYTYTNKDVILYKELNVYNQDETTVNAPTITYNYAVTLGTASTEASPVTVKDKFGVQVGVKAGLTGVKLSGAVSKTGESWTYGTANADNTTLAFTPAVQLTAAPGGSKNTFPIKIDFSDVNFAAAGVYRYIITETVNTATDDAASVTAKNAAGIADGTISNVRYLDVYVKDGASSGYDIYGFVCFQNVNSIDGTADTGNVTAIAKTEGFVADNGGENGTTALTADAYYTFNVTVSKTLVNDQAMNNNEFPFYVNMKNSSVTVPIILKTKTVEDGAEAVAGPDVSGTLSTETTGIAHTTTIDHQSNIKYIGIPVGITAATSVTAYETNNVTGTTYFSKYKVDTDADSTEKSLSWIVTGAEANTYTSDTATLTVTMNAADTTAHEIVFTNTLYNISPTGVALRYAPYLAMLGAGVVALPLSLRKKEELF